jgi:hypothetical protein
MARHPWTGLSKHGGNHARLLTCCMVGFIKMREGAIWATSDPIQIIG